MKNWGTTITGLLLICCISNNTTAETPKDIKIPLIVSDQCSATPDENGARRCEVTYSDGSVDTYWVKQGKIYWHYPINDRVPSGGEYRSK